MDFSEFFIASIFTGKAALAADSVHHSRWSFVPAAAASVARKGWKDGGDQRFIGTVSEAFTRRLEKYFQRKESGMEIILWHCHFP